LASLLHRCRLPEANQTLHDVWPSPSLVHYVYILGTLVPKGIFASCKVHFAFKCCALLYWQRYCTALEQWALAKLWSVVQGMELLNFRRGRHLYLAGRPSRWVSAHILVSNFICVVNCYVFDLHNVCSMWFAVISSEFVQCAGAVCFGQLYIFTHCLVLLTS